MPAHMDDMDETQTGREPINQSTASDPDVEWGEEATAWPPVYRDGKVHVVKDKCSTCVFRPGNLMHLDPGRLKGMVNDSIADGTGFACHQTLAYSKTEQKEHYGGEALCSGFVEKYGDQVFAIRMAHAVGCLEEVEPLPEKDGQ